MVTVDGARTSQATLRFAFDEAGRRHAGLIAGHTWTPPAVPIRADHIFSPGRLVTGVFARWRAAFPDVDVVELALKKSPEATLPQSSPSRCPVLPGCRAHRQRPILSGFIVSQPGMAWSNRRM
uniref:universal stress protein n=1 Tax=Paractinoplanes polyasparticus TaxID=2856853 RepID=UPI001C866977|nr:universal stress protein [Actinoplanes polyasparticus]